MNNDYFPTDFAINIAKNQGLYTKKEVPMPRYAEEVSVWHCGKKAGKAHERLQMFQTVSLKLPFDDCLNIYAGIKLTKKQRKALRKIHKATPNWMKGKMVVNMLTHLDNRQNTVGYTEDVIRLTPLIMEILNSEH